VCAPTFESSWGRCPQNPAVPRAMPSTPPAGARPGALHSRTRGWLRLYSPPSGFLRRRWGLCLADGSLRRATKRLAGRGCRPHPRFSLRSACLADGPLRRATKRLAGGSCRKAPAPAPLQSAPRTGGLSRLLSPNVIIISPIRLPCGHRAVK
jgi:hypothetical protein